MSIALSTPFSAGHTPIAYNAPHIPQQPAGMGNTQSIMRPSLLGQGQDEESGRGELEGDFVFTIDLTAKNDPVSAIWLEKDSVCRFTTVNKDISLQSLKFEAFLNSDENSSSSGELSSLLLQLFDSATKTLKPKKKSKQSITFVVPCSSTIKDRQKIRKIVAKMMERSLSIRNIVFASVANVAGMLSANKGFETAVKSTDHKQSPIVLFVATTEKDGSLFSVDYSFIRCETDNGSYENLLGFERLTIIKQYSDFVGGNGWRFDRTWVDAVAKCGFQHSDITAVVADSNLVEAFISSIREKLPNVFQAARDSACRGACLLSAAGKVNTFLQILLGHNEHFATLELSSSKQYIQLFDGTWKLFYQVIS